MASKYNNTKIITNNKKIIRSKINNSKNLCSKKRDFFHNQANLVASKIEKKDKMQSIKSKIKILSKSQPNKKIRQNSAKMY